MNANSLRAWVRGRVAQLESSPLHRRRAVTLTVVVLVLLALVLRSCEDGSKERFENSLTESSYTSTWLPYWDDGTGVESLRNNASRFTEVHPFWYETTSPGAISAQGSEEFRQRVIDIAKDKDVSLVPTVTTDIPNGAFQAMLANEDERAAHAELLCGLGKNEDFDGVDIDYENFAFGVAPADVSTVATRYASLVSEVRECLKGENKRVHVTVPARSNNADYPVRSTFAVGVFDYAKLGDAADVIRPMAYDYVTTGSPPGSIDPIAWSTQVARYAKDRVADNKVVLGIPFYGQNWVGTRATPITAGQATRLAQRERVQPQRDPVSRSLTFQYKAGDDIRTVWFDDPQATSERVEMAKKEGLAGVSYWALGQEDERYWKL